MKKILGTTFENVIQENGKKKAHVEGPLVPAFLLAPFGVFAVLGFAIGRVTKRR